MLSASKVQVVLDEDLFQRLLDKPDDVRELLSLLKLGTADLLLATATEVAYPTEIWELVRASTEREAERLLARYRAGERDLPGVVCPLIRIDSNDLSGINLEQADLRGASFANCNLDHANFENAKLTSVNFASCDLRNANLSGSDFSASFLDSNALRAQVALRALGNSQQEGPKSGFRGANLSQANLGRTHGIGADFSDAVLVKANFDGASLGDAHFARANLSEASLRGASMMDAHLKDAKLDHANMEGADLNEADLEHASLIGARMWDCRLSTERTRTIKPGESYSPPGSFGARLMRANLTDADLTGANLRGADLSHAILRDANFTDAFLGSTDLRGVDFEGAIFKGAHFLRANIDENLAAFLGDRAPKRPFDRVPLSKLRRK